MQTRSVRLDIFSDCGKPGYARQSFRHLAADKAASDDYVHAEARRMSELPGTLRVIAVETAPMRGDVATLATYEHGTRTDQPEEHDTLAFIDQTGHVCAIGSTASFARDYGTTDRRRLRAMIARDVDEPTRTITSRYTPAPRDQPNDNEPDNSTEYDDEEY